jgi:hypothetical protein
MALQPSLRPLIIAGRADAPHTLDIFRKAIGYNRMPNGLTGSNIFQWTTSVHSGDENATYTLSCVAHSKQRQTVTCH